MSNRKPRLYTRNTSGGIKAAVRLIESRGTRWEEVVGSNARWAFTSSVSQLMMAGETGRLFDSSWEPAGACQQSWVELQCLSKQLHQQRPGGEYLDIKTGCCKRVAIKRTSELKNTDEGSLKCNIMCQTCQGWKDIWTKMRNASLSNKVNLCNRKKKPTKEPPNPLIHSESFLCCIAGEKVENKSNG